MFRKYTAKRIATQEKTVEMLRLKKAGATYADIARHIGCAPSYVYKQIANAFAALPKEDATELRQMEVLRLDGALLIATKIMQRSRSEIARLQAVDRVVLISRRRSLLLGLDTSMAAEVVGIDRNVTINVKLAPEKLPETTPSASSSD